jgi:hypothetical protein
MMRTKQVRSRSHRRNPFQARVELLEERLPPGTILALAGTSLSELSYGRLDAPMPLAGREHGPDRTGAVLFQPEPLTPFDDLATDPREVAVVEGDEPLDLPAGVIPSPNLSLPVVPPAAGFFFAWDASSSWDADPLAAGTEFAAPADSPRGVTPPSREEQSGQGQDEGGAGSAAFLPPGWGADTPDDAPSPVSLAGPPGDALLTVLQVLPVDGVPWGDGGATIQNVGAGCEAATNGALTINVQSNTINAPVTTPTLASGQVYTLIAYGDAKIGNDLQKRGDPEFYWANSDPSTYYQGTDVGVRFVTNPTGFTNWGGKYQASHVYRARVTGSGAALSAYYLDADYSDNVGTVRLDVYEGDCLPADIPDD